MPTINDRIGSQNVIRVLSNASAPPTRIVNLTDVDTTRSAEDGLILVWDKGQETFYMTDVLDAYGYHFTAGPDASGITTFSGTTNSISVTTGSVTFAGGIGVGKNLNLGGQLAVTGISTFSNTVDVNADVDILRGLNVAGISSVQSLSIGSTQVISSARELQNITSLDATTTATIESAIKVAPNTFTDLKITGVSTFIGIATFGGGIAVQAGVSTFDAAVDINAGLDVDGQADLDEVVIAGVTTHNEDVYFPGAAYNMQWDKATSKIKFDDSAQAVFGSKSGGDLRIWHGGTHSFIKNETGDLRIRGDVIKLRNADDDESLLEATADADVKIFYNNIERVATTAEGIDVTGRTETDLLNVSGVSTFAGAIDANGSANIVGGLTLDQLNVTGVSTFGDDFVISAGGLDVTGIVTATGLDISTGGVDIDGQTDLDEVIVAGVSTFQSDVVIVGDSANVQWDRSQNSLEFSDSGYATFGDGRDLQIYHDSFNTYLDNNTGTLLIRSVSGTGGGIYLDPTSGERGLVVSPNGAVEAYWNALKRFETSGIGVTVTGQLDSTTLNVSGVSTFSSLVDVNNRLDVVGGAKLDQLNVTGVTTFYGSQTTWDLGGLGVLHTITPGGFWITGIVTTTDVNINKGLNVAGVATFSSAVDINAGLDVDGQADLDEVVVAGAATFSSTVTVSGNLDVADTIYHTGDSNTKIRFPANDTISFHTSGNEAFRINSSQNVNFLGDLINVNATGISSFVQLDVSTGGLDVDGQTDLDELVVAGIATFSTDVNITGLLTAGAIDGGSF